MILSQWKRATEQMLREEVKNNIRAGFIVEEHDIFDQKTLEELSEEVLVEDWEEIIENFEEIELIDEEDLKPWEYDLQETINFRPLPHGAKMDIEAELDLTVFELNMLHLSKIKDLLFAEDFTVTIDEADDTKAKIVFQRAGGEITKIKKCGPKMKLNGNRCIPQAGDQKSLEKVKGIKLKRAKKAMGMGAKKRAAIKAKITKKRVTGRTRSLSNTEN